ncbi:MAG: DNA-protecting protein DprA [Candidatus Omnitrophica bacterium]|nr:DNA-protecting protein DprA [Candidatus Omnitrophota bacterium]
MEIKKIDINNTEYPENLKNIFNPPRKLYVNGNILPQDKEAIAIVGTRRATYYGLEQCERLAYDLAIKGITVISGMARGIDTAAHRGALKGGARTIAVLGSGHNHIYPPENKKLYDKITENGAVISEFPPDTPPFKTNFPKRNRIISGMSKGVVVVEAPRRSGALITADFALEQGREVFAMPGNISSTRSNGTNRLIKEGAKLVENFQDILDELSYVINIKDVTSDEISPMASYEKIIFEILSDKPKRIDEIYEKTDLPTGKVSEALLKLELKKLIRMLPGENFVRL